VNRLSAALVAVALLAGCSSTSGTPPASVPPPAPSGTTAASGSPGGASLADWSSYHGTPDRAGVSAATPPVSGRPRVVAALKLDGAVYASPLVSGGTVVAATENDTVYALTLDGRVRWKQHLGTPAPGSQLPCGNIDPLGITGTPIVDHGVIYAAAEYGSPPRHQLVALSLADGAVRWRRSLDLPGVETRAVQERGALAVTGGRVWVPFGGLDGDCGGYKGRVVGVRLDGTGDPASYTVPTAREAGIWAPPGPSVDVHGDLFVQVGNGASVAGDRYDHSDSVLKLSASGHLLDSFSPAGWASDNAADLDLGSQGPALIGNRWIFAAGKSGTGYVLDQQHLGGIGGQVSQARVCTSFGGTAVVSDIVYVPCSDGVRAIRIDSAGTIHPLWHAAPAGSPVASGDRVWTLDPSAGVLHALDRRTGAAREQVEVGETSRFATPALYGSDVLVPTLAGLTIVRTS
jgi:hypothetical protein